MDWNKFNAGLGKNIAPGTDFKAGIANINTLDKKSFSTFTFFTACFYCEVSGLFSYSCP